MTIKRSALGKNLSALLQQTQHTLHPTSSHEALFQEIDIQRLVPGQYQPRNAMNEESLHQLATSIQQQGMLQPIIVRKQDNQFEIIAGERRWRAAKLAKLTKVPVIIKEVNNETALAMALVENLQREDLNPIEEAKAMQRLVEEFSLTHQQIADLLGKSRAAVSNYMRLLSLSENVLKFVEQGQLDMGHARALLTLTSVQQNDAAEEIIRRQLSVRDTEKLVEQLKSNAIPIRKIKPTFPIHVNQQIKSLQTALNTKIALKPKDDDKGSIQIHYSNHESLERIMSFLLTNS